MGINYKVKGMKRPNAPVEWTPERVKEYAKCANDIFYFAENYYTIVEEKKGKHVIKFFDYQRDMVKRFLEHRLNVVASGRQLGKCLDSQQNVGILNTSTGEVEHIKIGDFFDRL
jgi:hypothetical protein